MASGRLSFSWPAASPLTSCSMGGQHQQGTWEPGWRRAISTCNECEAVLQMSELQLSAQCLLSGVAIFSSSFLFHDAGPLAPCLYRCYRSLHGGTAAMRLLLLMTKGGLWLVAQTAYSLNSMQDLQLQKLWGDKCPFKTQNGQGAVRANGEQVVGNEGQEPDWKAEACWPSNHHAAEQCRRMLAHA